MKSNRVLIIAEAGVNRNGELGKALVLIDIAAQAGADYVKFQTFKADKIVNRLAKNADYQKENMQGDRETQYEMLKKLEIGDYWYSVLMHRCKEIGIHFLSTGFDGDSIDFPNKH
jgi:N-acetylneuraminate synthase/N,N'-diacetyllegionaminate synthase